MYLLNNMARVVTSIQTSINLCAFAGVCHMTYTLQDQPEGQVAEEQTAPDQAQAQPGGHSLDTTAEAEPLRTTGDDPAYRVPPLSIVMLVSMADRMLAVA